MKSRPEDSLGTRRLAKKKIKRVLLVKPFWAQKSVLVAHNLLVTKSLTANKRRSKTREGPRFLPFLGPKSAQILHFWALFWECLRVSNPEEGQDLCPEAGSGLNPGAVGDQLQRRMRVVARDRELGRKRSAA
jgi:hypothetical protein